MFNALPRRGLPSLKIDFNVIYIMAYNPCFLFYIPSFGVTAMILMAWVSKVSKQERYFVEENYELFSTEVSAREKQGQNNGGPHQGVIGSLGSSSAVRPFWICSPVGEYLSLNVPCRSLCIVQFLFLPSSCEVSLRKQFKKTPGKCRTSWVCD